MKHVNSFEINLKTTIKMNFPSCLLCILGGQRICYELWEDKCKYFGVAGSSFGRIVKINNINLTKKMVTTEMKIQRLKFCLVKYIQNEQRH